MSQSNDILEPCLVVVDSHTLSVVDDYIQDYSNECESLAYALNIIEVNDPASKGVIVAIRSALVAISENASELSDGLMTQLILQPQVEVTSHE